MPLPFDGRIFTLTQPDGTSFQVRGSGNQHFAVFEDLDGYVVVRDPASGYFQYARLNPNATMLVPTGAQVGRDDPAALDLTRGIRVKREAARAAAAASRLAGGRGRRWEERIAEKRQAKLAARAAARDGRAFAPPSEETVGDYAGICILIQFPDVAWTIARAEVDDYCNKVGYDGFGNNGSVHDYFLDISNGRLRYANQVTEYYTAEEPRSHYTDEGMPDGQRARELIREALADLENDGFDFSSLTTDSSGFVRALNVFYVGPVVNNWSKGLWPHSWHLGVPYEVAPGIKFFDYQFTNMGSELALGTFCHENGHMICDFPDLYDYGYESNGIGHFCLMCAGGTDDKNPVRVCAYLNRAAGWAEQVTPAIPGLEGTLTADRDEFLIHSKTAEEYFLIEHRAAQGRDSGLPASGLAIWHVDEDGKNDHEGGTPSLHYECALEQADGLFNLEKKVNQGDWGDLFSAVTKTSFGDATQPNSRWWDGTSSGLEIRDIGDPGGAIGYRIPGGNVDDGSVHGVSEPGLAIPADIAAGVQDVISLDATGNVGFVEVDVDITHTYQGDLKITLRAPSGVAAVLHDRRGGGANDVQETYDTETSPGLRNLLDEPIRGPWTLEVADHAPVDTGTLNRWGLTVRPAAAAVVEIAESPGITIPDNDPGGIRRALTASGPGTIGAVNVTVDITHSYIRDLKVTLVSPAGTRIDLHSRTGGNADNIIQTYSVTTLPALEALRGEPIQGDWTLEVSDHEGQDVGKLNRWSVLFRREGTG